MNCIHYTTEDIHACHIWVAFEHSNIEVYSFKTHKEATKFVDYFGRKDLECGYFDNFHLHTFEKTEKFCKNVAFDDNSTLWEVLQDDKKSVFKSDD